jgi:hypothetical protein
MLAIRQQSSKTAGTLAKRIRPQVIIAVLQFIPVAVSLANTPVLIEFSSGLDHLQSNHSSPDHIARNIPLIESRPFDGIVINEYWGRNLLNTQLPTSSATEKLGLKAITYEAAMHGLAPVKGVFKKFKFNFAKVNFSMAGPPPALFDDAAWNVVYESAMNYSRAVHDTGLKGVFFDNESYYRRKTPGTNRPLDDWSFQDQRRLSAKFGSTIDFESAILTARRRGRELMRAFSNGFPDITVIMAHGPSVGCSAWRSLTGHFGDDAYLLGAFGAGMIEGTSRIASIVDGGEDYDLRSKDAFEHARNWRKGDIRSLMPSITSLSSNGKCPFMDQSLAALWTGRVSIGFSTFDKERTSLKSNNWTPITDVAEFRETLTNALRATDQYVWNYTQWQDWWGTTTDDKLRPWIDAINAARSAASTNPKSNVN